MPYYRQKLRKHWFPGLNNATGSTTTNKPFDGFRLRRIRLFGCACRCRKQQAAGSMQSAKGMAHGVGPCALSALRLADCGLNNSRDSTDATTGLGGHDQCAVYLDSHTALEQVNGDDQEALVRIDADQDSLGTRQHSTLQADPLPLP